jgi:hypothetical protein
VPAGGAKSVTEGLSSLSCGSPLENRVLFLYPLPTHLGAPLSGLLSAHTWPQLACLAAVVAPGAALSLWRRLAPAVVAAPRSVPALARAVGGAQEAYTRTAPAVWEAVRYLPGPGTPYWPTWGWLGYYATPPRRPDASRPTHLASELEVFWTGRGGSFALSFLALSLSARLLLVIVLAGVL